ncbi:MAG: T9SS type A sorting domain-containing protein, partial [Cytophagales bacterium]|nr:T9SS type A sorting domain-containing protein [Cytophagales bacterium]
NPANELLNVALGNITGGASDLMITDMSGKVLFSERGVIGNKEIDTSTLENGLYLLVIKNAEIHHQIKFLVTH